MLESDGVPMLRNLVGYNPANEYPWKDTWRLSIVLVRTYRAWFEKWTGKGLLPASKSHEMACMLL